LNAEDVAVLEAAGRTLAREVTTDLDLPPFDRAAADGFALRADDSVGASTYNPLPLRVVDAADELPPGTTARVHAGDRLPGGADAVAALEQAGDDDGGTCWIAEPVVPGAFVERKGSHLARGSRLASAGRRLRPADVGLLAAAGVGQAPVVRRPHVRCVLAGRKLVAPGGPLSADAVPDANGPLLGGLVVRDGGLLIERRQVDRGLAAIRAALASPGADVILVAGSSGLGPDDHAAAALAEAGELAFRGVALYPGETTSVGRTTSGALVFLLPGAPAACLCGYELCAGRAIRRLSGLSAALPFAVRTMVAARKIVSAVGMTEVCPVRCASDGTVAPVASFAEAGLAAAAQADGFVIVPEDLEGYAQGAPVVVYLYDEASHYLAAKTGHKP
jgi:molybdopterin molybdotransferase